MDENTGKPTLPDELAELVRAEMRELRKTRFATDAEMARALDRSGASVSNILKGIHKPSYETLVAIAALRGVDVSAMLYATLQEKEYPNRAVVMASPEFRSAPPLVQQRFRELRRRDADQSVVKWSIYLTRLIELHAMDPSAFDAKAGTETKETP